MELFVLYELFVVNEDTPEERTEFDDLGYFDSVDKAIAFLRECTEDDNSGIDRNTMIQLCQEKLNFPFDGEGFMDRKKVKEWLK